MGRGQASPEHLNRGDERQLFQRGPWAEQDPIPQIYFDWPVDWGSPVKGC